MKFFTLAYGLAFVCRAAAQTQEGMMIFDTMNRTFHDVIDSIDDLKTEIDLFAPTLRSECAVQKAAQDLLTRLDQSRDTLIPLPHFPDADSGSTELQLIYPVKDL